MTRVALALLAFAVPLFAVAADTGVASDLERLAQTTPAEKKAYATESVDEITGEVKLVERALEAARRAGNAEQVTCVNNRLVALRALLQVSAGAESAMGQALDAENAPIAEHEFRKIAVAREKAQQLRAEADACADQGLGNVKGDATVTVNGGAGDASDLVNPYQDLVFTFDPPEASPFM